jgi:integrase
MFYLKDKKKERTSIQAIIRFKGKRYKIPTGENVITEFWNQDKERCSIGRKNPDGAFVNAKLDLLEADLKKILNDFNLSNTVPTIQEVKKKIQEEQGDQGKQAEQMYFVPYLEKQIKEQRQLKALSTIKKYVTTLNKLKAYEQDRKRKLSFQDIDIVFYYDFREWFYSQFNTKNYFGSVIKVVKKFMNKSLVDGLHDFKGHKHPEFITEQEDADTVYLNLDELRKIYELKITDEVVRELYPKIYAQNLRRKKESLEKVRARFLIGAYTLLRVSDFKRLSEINIKEGFIRIKPKKRAKGRKNRDVFIPIHPIVKEIIDSGFDLSETISEQKINKHIKEICRLAEITDEEVIVRTEKGKEVEKYYEKCELITTHTARRSAATNMLMSGMEASDIMILGGWSSEKSFWRYIRMEPEVNARRLADHPFFRE